MKNSIFTRLLVTVVFLFTLNGCIFDGGNNEGGGSETETELINISEWLTWGTVVNGASGELVVGDTIGFDSGDVDGDGNTWGNPNEDNDVALSVETWSAPLSLVFSGSLSATNASYHYVGMAYENGGSPQGVALFSLDWEGNPQLRALVQGEGYTALSNSSGPIVASGGVLSGDFKIVWDGSVVTFYYNGENVYQTNLMYDTSKDIQIWLKSFDGPLTFTDIVVVQ